MTRWQVEITGHRFDLEDLSASFTDPRFRVVEVERKFFHEAAQLEDLDISAEVHEAARHLVSQINGIAMLHNPSFRAVAVGSGVRELDDRGQERQHVVLTAATVEARSKVSAVTVKVSDIEPEPPPPGSLRTDRWMRMASSDLDVREAVDLWSSPRNWVSLYKIFEIIRARANIVDAGWASESELNLFKWTANHQDAAGPDARHARLNREPPPAPMSLPEAEALLNQILVS